MAGVGTEGRPVGRSRQGLAVRSGPRAERTPSPLGPGSRADGAAALRWAALSTEATCASAHTGPGTAKALLGVCAD